MENITESSEINFSERLISLVKAQPILYRKQHRDYKNTVAKGRIWSKIAEKLSSTEDICERRWRSLREKYSRELKKFNALAGSAEHNDQLSQWDFWEDMSFLKDEIKPRNPRTNKGTSSPSSPLQDSILDEILIEPEVGDSSSNGFMGENRKRKIVSHNHLEEKMNTAMDICTDYLKQKSPDTGATEDSFSHAVNAILGMLNSDNRKRAKADILAYLADVYRSELDPRMIRPLPRNILCTSQNISENETYTSAKKMSFSFK